MPRVIWLSATVALLVGVLVAVSVTGAVSAAQSAQTRWVIVDLGTLGGRESEASAINDRGQVVGWSETAVDSEGNQWDLAFLWQHGKMTNLSPGPGADIWPSAINDRGQVVGSMDAAMGVMAWLWEKGKLTFLDSLGVAATAEEAGRQDSANSINNHGQIVGSSSRPWSYVDRAVLWQGKIMIAALGTLGGKESEASSINERGQIVGRSKTARGSYHAFLWEKGKMIDLGTLGGKESEASSINERGRIVGSSFNTAGKTRAVLWAEARGS
jgi:probable HAF family extracellular repeat protein